MKLKASIVAVTVFMLNLAMFQNLYAADCAVGFTATNGATLTHTTWNSEFGTVMGCINNRLEEAGGNMTGNLNVHSGYDLNWYSDTGSTLKATVDGATGNATFNDVTLGATDKLYLDGGSDTYIYEQGGNTVQIVAGGTSALTAGSAAVVVDSGRDLVMTGGKKIYLDGGTDTYLYLQGDNTAQIVTGNNAALTVGGGGTVVENGPLWAPSLNQKDGDDVEMWIDLTTKEMKKGPASSSARYKKNITNLKIDSSKIYDLRPVSFDYKNIEPEEDYDPAHKDIGLIAEEVQAILPELVIHNLDGTPESVYYHKLPILMLAEIIKLNERVEDLENQLRSRN